MKINLDHTPIIAKVVVLVVVVLVVVYPCDPNLAQHPCMRPHLHLLLCHHLWYLAASCRWQWPPEVTSCVGTPSWRLDFRIICYLISYLIPHTSHLIPYLIPHTSYLTSYLIPHTSHLIPYLIPYIIPHTSRLTSIISIRYLKIWYLTLNIQPAT